MFWLLQLIVVGGGGRVVLVLLLMFFASEQQKRGKNLYIQTPDQLPLAATIFTNNDNTNAGDNDCSIIMISLLNNCNAVENSGRQGRLIGSLCI